MRPTLRPGLRLLRRDQATLQLGLDWPGLTLLHDTPALRAVLDSVDGFRAADAVIMAAVDRGQQRRACEDALAVLVECGAVVDGNQPPDCTVPEASWAAWSLLAGPGREARDVASSRRRHRVVVTGTGIVADEIRRLMPLSHVTQTDDRGSADLVVLALDDEASRDESDEIMHLGVPHLWVSVRDLVGVVGPFVVPGHTACLRCVDAARSDLDPAWTTLLASAAAKPLRVPAGDGVVAALVAAWAVHEVALWASEIQPQTWGHVLEIPYGSGAAERIGFDRHPRCGCGWVGEHDTIGA